VSEWVEVGDELGEIFMEKVNLWVKLEKFMRKLKDLVIIWL